MLRISNTKADLENHSTCAWGAFTLRLVSNYFVSNLCVYSVRLGFRRKKSYKKSIMIPAQGKSEF